MMEPLNAIKRWLGLAPKKPEPNNVVVNYPPLNSPFGSPGLSSVQFRIDFSRIPKNVSNGIQTDSSVGILKNSLNETKISVPTNFSADYEHQFQTVTRRIRKAFIEADKESNQEKILKTEIVKVKKNKKQKEELPKVSIQAQKPIAPQPNKEISPRVDVVEPEKKLQEHIDSPLPPSPKPATQPAKVTGFALSNFKKVTPKEEDVGFTFSSTNKPEESPKRIEKKPTVGFALTNFTKQAPKKAEDDDPFSFSISDTSKSGAKKEPIKAEQKQQNKEESSDSASNTESESDSDSDSESTSNSETDSPEEEKTKPASKIDDDFLAKFREQVFKESKKEEKKPKFATSLRTSFGNSHVSGGFEYNSAPSSGYRGNNSRGRGGYQKRGRGGYAKRQSREDSD